MACQGLETNRYGETEKKLTVLEVHLDGGAIGSFAHPGIQILAFSCLEEEHVVAVV